MSEKYSVIQIGMGFIGSTYVKRTNCCFNNFIIKRLEKEVDISITTSDNEAVSFTELPKKIDAIIVFAYSDNRSDNFYIANQVFSLAKKLQVNRIIYIGSAAIYDIDDGVYNEKAPLNRYYEFYAKTKTDIVNLVKKNSLSFSGKVIILHPTVVFGFGGNWDLTIRNSLKCGQVNLPSRGLGLCNPIHVYDVCKAIDLSIIKNNPKTFSEYIISSGIAMPWKKIYENMKYIYESNGDNSGSIVYCAGGNRFNDGFFKNLLYHFVYSSFGFFCLLFFKKFLEKKHKKEKSNKIQDYQFFNVYKPQGIYRLLHAKRQFFSIELAQNDLGFYPEYSTEEQILRTFRD